MSEREHYLPIYQVSLLLVGRSGSWRFSGMLMFSAALRRQHGHERAGEGHEEGARSAVRDDSAVQQASAGILNLMQFVITSCILNDF